VCGRTLCVLCELEQCTECGKITCNKCQRACALCKQSLCAEHISECAHCLRQVCTQCSLKCLRCGGTICKDDFSHRQECCRECAEKVIKLDRPLEEMPEDSAYRKLSEGTKRFCPQCSYRIEDPGASFCVMCGSKLT
jgi:hypothetical protein